MTPTILKAESLRKTFSRPKPVDGPFSSLRTLFTREKTYFQAVRDVSFELSAGEIVGYLGPNGAGKSTTIKMLTGIVVPDSGTVKVAGLVPWQNRQRNAMNIGVVFGQRSQLWWTLPLRESLKLIGSMYRMSPESYRRSLATLTDVLDLAPFLETPVRQLSLGQRMRGDIAAAMLYEPPILFLDEPTVGLDVVAKESVRSFIEFINRERGTTVLLTTHDLADVERLCHRVLIIDSGQTIYDGSIPDLRQQFAPERIITLTVAPDQQLDWAELLKQFPNGVGVISDVDGKAEIAVDARDADVKDVLRMLVERVPLQDITIADQPMDRIVREIYQQGGQA